MTQCAPNACHLSRRREGKMKTAKEKDSERRQGKRHSIRVLVNCLPPGTTAKRNGHVVRGWEMWARDLADDGVGLLWNRDWASARCPECFGPIAGKAKPRAACECKPPDGILKAGQEVLLDGLVYNDQGSEPMVGRIQWVRPSKSGKTFEAGVHITTPNHRDYFKALED